jgi:peptide chain release factor 1
MWNKLEQIEKRHDEIIAEMSKSEVVSDHSSIMKLAREKATIDDIVNQYRDYKATLKHIDDTRAIQDDKMDAEMAAFIKQELHALEEKRDRLQEELKLSLLPKDPNNDRNVILEIRAGTGGDEAGIFAADLFKMYSRYAQAKRWAVDIINISEGGGGGYKEVIAEVKGKGAFSRFKYERGVHRVQRVPLTEASGRIHTSTATVAVLPEVEDVEVDIKPEDLRIDIFHSGGAGGQNVNKVSTAVRLTHLPTGLVVVCQDERSQLQNRQKAMAVLKARLYEQEQRKQEEEMTSMRRSQVGSGERAEKVRTYNFPQDRLTDHRIGLTLHNLPKIMAGEIDAMIDALATDEQTKLLQEQIV